MTKQIKKIGVIGAGTMGKGIAAQAANAGVEVVLLDLTKERADKAIQDMLDAKPTDAFENGFMSPGNAKHITTGSSIDDLEMLADCDWVVESILVKDPQIRQDLYKKIQKITQPDTIFSSNTSMDTTSDMTYDQDEAFKKRFLNTHFFNPVRSMHLLETIVSEHTDPDVAPAIADFGSKMMGKKVIPCKDERGFIGNRFGIMAIELVLNRCLELDTKIEDADAIMGQAFGFPQLGIFKLADEVGLDVVDHVRSDFHENLPEDDAYQQIFTGNEDLQKMLTDGYVGNRKKESKGGFYRVKKDENGKVVKGDNGRPLKEARDLRTAEYRDFENSPYFKFEKQIKKFGSYDKFFDSDHPAAEFAWPIIRDLMIYVLDHAEELAFDVQSVDDAMRAGYNWDYGPFELLDQFGVDWFTNKLKSEGIEIPDLLAKANGEPFYQEHENQLKVRHFDGSLVDIKREEGVLNLDDIKRKSEPLVTHHSASLWDIGDGVVCLEFHSKENSIDPSILHVMNESIKLVSDNDDYKAMVIYNDNTRFSVGANLKLAEVFMNVADNNWDSFAPMIGKKWAKRLETIAPKIGLPDIAQRGLKNILHEMIYQGQAVYTALQQAPFPVIGAPKGQAPKSMATTNLALGGGCEVLLNCDALQAGPEQFMGLPEIGVGIVPAWTGTTRYLERVLDSGKAPNGPMAPVVQAATMLADPIRSTSLSSQDAKKKLWLRPDDGISMNPDRVLTDAKDKALSMVSGYQPKPLPTFRLAGQSGRNAVRMNVDKMYLAEQINHVDVKAADRLATVLTGGETLERDDVRHHTEGDHDHLEQLIDSKPDGNLKVNPTIEFNYSRMMQLERDYILDAFNDKAATWPRLRHMLATNKPLREDRLDPAPTPKDMRDSMQHEDLPRRNIEGQPLTEKDGDTLEAMADMTTAFYKLNERGGSPIAKVGGALLAVRRTLNMF